VFAGCRVEMAKSFGIKAIMNRKVQVAKADKSPDPMVTAGKVIGIGQSC
jgi:hypothetical protein